MEKYTTEELATIVYALRVYWEQFVDSIREHHEHEGEPGYDDDNIDFLVKEEAEVKVLLQKVEKDCLDREFKEEPRAIWQGENVTGQEWWRRELGRVVEQGVTRDSLLTLMKDISLDIVGKNIG